MNSKLTYLSFVVIAATLGYTIYLHTLNKKNVVVDVYKLVDGFKLKTELEQKQALEFAALNDEIDSFSTIMNRLKSENKMDLLDKMSAPFYAMQLKAKDAMDKSNDQLNGKIWERLNPLIDQFGKENNYNLIQGGNGSGTILYCDPSYDITESLINYVNTKYINGK